jgi:hypothetical protein
MYFGNMRFHFSLLLLFFSNCLLAQTRSRGDSILYYGGYYETKYIAIGSSYDIANRIIGLNIGNGGDDRPLIHFEEFSADLVYKIYGQTNFEENYKWGGIITDYYIPIGSLYLPMLSLKAEQQSIGNAQTLIRSFDFSTSPQIRLFTSLQLTGHLLHQKIHSSSEIGLGIGVRKTHQKVYYGIQIDYLSEYLNYKAYLFSQLIQQKLSLQLSYERIHTFDFLNIGLSMLLSTSQLHYGESED